MSIISLSFFPFLLLVAATFFLIPGKLQWVVLCLANIIFYLCAGEVFLLYVLITSLAIFWAALALEAVTKQGKSLLSAADSAEEKKVIRKNTLLKKKLISTLALLISLGIWVVVKYGNFLLQNINVLFRTFKVGMQFHELNVLVPLGISYYTFHAVGYLIDVYRGKYPPERNFARLFTFISFFPHMIQGPFSRYDQLGKSLFDVHHFSYDRFCEGTSRILWGYFKKLLIADKLGIAVATIFGSPTNYTGAYFLFAMVFYGLQIYADFSGYMDIMCGFCHILGIQLAENFHQPYFAKSVDEFWRRWHITLGKWFKDYVFYPVSMGKTAQKMGKWARKKYGAKAGKLLPGYFALIFVWSITGLWHGANWTFWVWGYLNLFIIIFSMQMEDVYASIKAKLHIHNQVWWQFFCIVRTFLLVCCLRFFSIADNMSSALATLRHAIHTFDLSVIRTPLSLFDGMTSNEIIVAMIGCIMVLFVDILNETGHWEAVKKKCPFLIRNVIYAAMIFAIILFSGGDNDLVRGFIYANF